VTATMRDVARRSRVSVAAVSNVLHRTAPVAEETRRRVLAAIEELGYRQNEVARSLKRCATRTLGVSIPDALNPFHATVALEVPGAREESIDARPRPGRWGGWRPRWR
jgi:LacI family transcriptional regulator